MMTLFLKVYGLLVLVECLHIFIMLVYWTDASAYQADTFHPDVKLQLFLASLAGFYTFVTYEKKAS